MKCMQSKQYMTRHTKEETRSIEWPFGVKLLLINVSHFEHETTFAGFFFGILWCARCITVMLTAGLPTQHNAEKLLLTTVTEMSEEMSKFEVVNLAIKFETTSRDRRINLACTILVKSLRPDSTSQKSMIFSVLSHNHMQNSLKNVSLLTLTDTACLHIFMYMPTGNTTS